MIESKSPEPSAEELDPPNAPRPSRWPGWVRLPVRWSLKGLKFFLPFLLIEGDRWRFTTRTCPGRRAG
jgi:hypothetical protein